MGPSIGLRHADVVMSAEVQIDSIPSNTPIGFEVRSVAYSIRQTTCNPTSQKGQADFLRERLFPCLSHDGADPIHLYHGNASLLAESSEVIQQTSAVIFAALEPTVPDEIPEAELAKVA